MAKRGNVTVKGTEAIVKAVDRLGRSASSGVRRGLKIWGEETITLAKAEYVPFKYGVLKGSGDAELKDAGDTVEVELSFGGNSPAGAYAIPVHERPANHKHGTDKYLEKPAMKEASKLQGVIASEIKKDTRI